MEKSSTAPAGRTQKHLRQAYNRNSPGIFVSCRGCLRKDSYDPFRISCAFYFFTLTHTGLDTA